MRNLKLFSAMLIALLFFEVKGQDAFVDSLNNLLESKPNDSVKASVLGDLCWHYKYSDAPKALAYGFEAAEIAKRNKFDQLLAYIYNNIGVVYWARSDYDSAQHFISKTRELYKQLNNERGIAVTSVNLGLIVQNTGAYDKSLDYQLEALRLFDKINDERGKASALTNIGNVHFLNEDYRKALRYYSDALQLKQKIEQTGFSQNIQKTLLNIGNVYEKLNIYDSAIHYFRRTEPFAKAASDFKNLSLVYTDLGHVYSKIGKYDSAEHYFNKALDVFNKKQYENPYDLSILHWSIAENELRRKNIKDAVKHAETSLDLSKSLKNHNRLKDVYALLTEVYEASGQLSKALFASEMHRLYEDSLINIETNKQIATLEKQYETEKKDQQIQLLNLENEKQLATNQRNLIIIVALIACVLFLVIIFYLWLQRVRHKQQQVLNEQKLRMREAQIKAVIGSEEKERKRFAADLHDSLGQLISTLGVNIQSLRSQNGNPEKTNEIFENSNEILGDIQKEIRNIAFNLMPPILTKEGLIAALKELTVRINKSQQMTIDLKVFGLEQRFNEVYEISLYRILQEWISNILKYSGATKTLIQFTEHEDEVIITVEDNGNGFDLNNFKLGKGNGWKNINTRINLLKGNLDIDTEPGRKGTTLIVSFNKERAYTALEVLENTDD